MSEPMQHLHQTILLASKSPRRRQLLEAAGFPYETLTLDTPETYPDHLPASAIAPYLAEKKAAAALGYLQPGQILLCADSVVILHNKVYEKAANYDEAYAMLSALSGQVHEVVTGVCLQTDRQKRVFSGHSFVHLAELSHAEKDYYINNYHPYDKAGAYGIQDWIGWCKVTRIEGSYSNIMGLPMELVYAEIAAICRPDSLF